ncbi:MAG: DUF3108 domain-containing protein [Betaproteobacteria bacterium]|nr:DUF3108 domain-containing protein [Betaproteobacteria bacterium]
MIRALLLLCMTSLAATAAEPPRHVEMTYSVSWNGLTIGKGTDKFEHNGREFRITSDTKTEGDAAMLYNFSIHVESKGLITKSGLQPLSYQEDRTKKPRRSARFDWSKRQVHLDSGKGSQTLELPRTPIFDKSSFAWSFAFAPPAGKESSVVLTDGTKLSEYRYAIIGRQKTKTPAGEFDTVHVKKIQENDDKRGFEVWLAVQHHHLPVRIKFIDDDTFDSVATSLKFPG